MPGIAGSPGFRDTAKVFAALVPQEFFAFTVIFPLPEVPVVTVIELVELLPVHPEGNVQIYSSAPETALMA